MRPRAKLRQLLKAAAAAAAAAPPHQPGSWRRSLPAAHQLQLHELCRPHGTALLQQQQQQQQQQHGGLLTTARTQLRHAAPQLRGQASSVPQAPAQVLPLCSSSTSSSSSSSSSSGSSSRALGTSCPSPAAAAAGYELDYAHSLWPGQPLPPLEPGGGAAAAAAAAAAACSIEGPPGASSTSRSSSSAPAASPAAAPRGRVVAVALSGGVDSAVAALLLRQQGYQVFGVFMHNWDAADEAGAGRPSSRVCSAAADLADARAAASALGLRLLEADFVADYWHGVFQGFLDGLAHGLTPNPDVACNSVIKFGALLSFARAQGADLLATGHYARLGWSSSTELPAADGGGGAVAGAWRPVLLTGADASKDQSYFLAGLHHQQLARALFPVGHLSKASVRALAAQHGLPQAAKRSSAGICFIGRRSFGRFLEAYLPPAPAVYVDVASGQALGPCANALAVTVGQRTAGLGGQAGRVYVAGRDLAAGVVHVAAGHDHPALLTTSVLLQAPTWVAGHAPAALAAPGGVLACRFQARYRQEAEPCMLRVLTRADAAAFVASRLCAAAAGPALRAAAAAGADDAAPSGLLVAELPVPLRGAAPGQAFVLYDGDVCLGSAVIVGHGPTLFEQQQQPELQGLTCVRVDALPCDR